ncbi:MAG: hypothetical protein ACXW1Q_06520 [Halobacteriota archaeon]
MTEKCFKRQCSNFEGAISRNTALCRVTDTFVVADLLGDLRELTGSLVKHAR